MKHFINFQRQVFTRPQVVFLREPTVLYLVHDQKAVLPKIPKEEEREDDALQQSDSPALYTCGTQTKSGHSIADNCKMFAVPYLFFTIGSVLSTWTGSDLVRTVNLISVDINITTVQVLLYRNRTRVDY